MKNTLKIATPTDCQIVFTRDFDAPRHLVWDAMTKPELIRRWLFLPPGWEMTGCDEDVRVGGAFRWTWSDGAGGGMVMHGAYREVDHPKRMVRTETFEMGCNAAMGERLATLELDEKDGKTKVTITLVYASKQDRDGAIASGMERGMSAEGYDQLDEMLAGKR